MHQKKTKVLYWGVTLQAYQYFPRNIVASAEIRADV